MKEAQDGSSSSYETLLTEVYMFLQSYITRKISNSSQVEDVIQEVLMALHHSRHTYDCKKSFMSWFLAITHYKISDYLRVQFKHQISELDENIVDSAADALSLLIENQSLRAVQLALSELEQKPREVVNLLKLEGFKISEVAKKLNLSEANVKVIAHRAYQQLEVKLRGKV